MVVVNPEDPHSMFIQDVRMLPNQIKAFIFVINSLQCHSVSFLIGLNHFFIYKHNSIKSVMRRTSNGEADKWKVHIEAEDGCAPTTEFHFCTTSQNPSLSPMQVCSWVWPAQMNQSLDKVYSQAVDDQIYYVQVKLDWGKTRKTYW